MLTSQEMKKKISCTLLLDTHHKQLFVLLNWSANLGKYISISVLYDIIIVKTIPILSNIIASRNQHGIMKLQ